MNKKAHNSGTHITIGIIVLAILYYLNMKSKWLKLTEFDLVWIIGIVIIYSTMPDCDQPGSKINKYFVTIIGILAIYGIYKNIKPLAVGAIVIIVALKYIHHRTWLHSIVGGAIMSAPLYFIKPMYFVVALVAFIIHLVSEGELSVFAESDIKIFRRK